MIGDEPEGGPLRRFLADYHRLRVEEGFASDHPAFARQLPFRDATGRNAAVWRVRALHYLVMRAALALRPSGQRILDVGAGNGWLARRLAGTHRVTAIDVDATSAGLGAIDDPRVHRVRGELEALPLRDETFDVVIAAASLHYAVDLAAALGELARVLRPTGILLIADSPVYPDGLARHRAWLRTLEYYGSLGAAHLARRYHGLTRAELDGAGRFHFVTLSPGLGTLRGMVGRWRAGAHGPRMPVLLGRKLPPPGE